MKYLIQSDFLASEIEADVHGDKVILANGEEIIFEHDPMNPAFIHAIVDGRKIGLITKSEDNSAIALAMNGYEYPLQAFSERDLHFQRLLKETASKVARSTKIQAPMPGLIKSVFVQNGQHVKKGERLLILEAMKMENDIKSPTDGFVSHINVASGSAVEKNHILCQIDAVLQG